MSELPHPWGAYARLQARSSRNSRIDSFSWGMEEEMNLFVADPVTYISQGNRRSERLRATVARRERHRANLRKIHEIELAPPPINPVAHFEAREALGAMESALTPAQWELVLAVAMGYEYAEIHLKRGFAVLAARAQMYRLRQRLAHLHPAA